MLANIAWIINIWGNDATYAGHKNELEAFKMLVCLCHTAEAGIAINFINIIGTAFSQLHTQFCSSPTQYKVYHSTLGQNCIFILLAHGPSNTASQLWLCFLKALYQKGTKL